MSLKEKLAEQKEKLSTPRERQSEWSNSTYYTIMLVFALGQLVLSLVMYGVTGTSPLFLLAMAAVGVVDFVLVAKGWKRRTGRIVGRVLQYLPMLLYFSGAAVVILMSLGQTPAELMPVYYKRLFSIGHIIIVFILPSMVFASPKAWKTDVMAVRITGIVNLAVGGVLYLVPSVYELLDANIDNLLFRIFCVLCMAVVPVTAFLIPYKGKYKRKTASSKNGKSGKRTK